MKSNEYVLQALLLMTLATFLCRAMPFLFLKGFAKNKLLHFVGDYLPCSAMILLVIYCLKDTNFIDTPHGVPEILGVLIVSALHLYKRNALLSILGGTVVYLAIMRF